MVLQSIKFDSVSGELEILDQLLLPEKTQYIKVKGVETGWSVINKMQVNMREVNTVAHLSSSYHK
jgi:methylthioribose-1-phosphate isomerase